MKIIWISSGTLAFALTGWHLVGRPFEFWHYALIVFVVVTNAEIAARVLHASWMARKENQRLLEEHDPSSE